MSPGTLGLLPFVLVSFAANSLITRHVVDEDLLDAGLLTCVRFLSGAAVLVGLCLLRRERIPLSRRHVMPALWLGMYAVCISYGYAYIGAAAGTFVFYASVLLTLVADDRLRTGSVPARRLAGGAVALGGIGVLASATSAEDVTLLGVLLLVATGTAWGLYTAAGRGAGDPRIATTGAFVVLALALLLPTAALVATGAPATGSGLLWGVVMGAGTTAFAYVAWYACQRVLSASSAGLVQLVIPLLTTVGAVLLLDEPLTVRLLVAAVLVGAGMQLGRAVPPTQVPAPAR